MKPSSRDSPELYGEPTNHVSVKQGQLNGFSFGWRVLDLVEVLAVRSVSV